MHTGKLAELVGPTEVVEVAIQAAKQPPQVYSHEITYRERLMPSVMVQILYVSDMLKGCLGC